MKRRLLVIGNGMCSLRLLEELIAIAAGSFEITVVGTEPVPAYNRVLLSPLLAGELSPADVELKPAEWYARNGIDLQVGQPVTAIDRATRTATLGDGRHMPFDICVLATGSEPIRLPLPGNDLDGVVTFRSLRDAHALRSAAKARAAAVVIGGGLLGIEAAYGLVRAGAEVTLVHLVDRLMERQLDAEAARLLAVALEAKGIRVILGATASAICGHDRVEVVALTNEQKLDCGLVVMAVGVRPSTVLAREAGLETHRGILVDDRMATSADGIFALGECAEHRGQCYGLIEPGYEQAKILAHHLAGRAGSYEGSVVATSLKVSGIPVFSIGAFDDVQAEAIVLEDREAAVYRKLVVRDGHLIGAVLYGDTSDALWYRQLIGQRTPVAAIRGALAFGKAYAEAA
ncbi:MAG: NAD(P)/FAD-dependent oxidoreductase [Sphingomonadales bacterium]|nr:NAD(P)/FAD-dependent oxidoreductase [Sphingomonadales bacterium]